MTLNVVTIAGISVTIAVAAKSVVNLALGAPNKGTAAARTKHGKRAVHLPYRSASQDAPYVTGNMVLATNL